jgi:transposase-like protein
MTGEAIDAVSPAFEKALIERVLGAELSHHLGYEPGGEKPDGQGNCRNGVGHKPLRTDTGAIRIEVPRDRDGRFVPLLVPKHVRRFTGFDDKIIARGMTVREIQGFLRDPYGVEASAEFIGTVTDAVMAGVSA